MTEERTGVLDRLGSWLSPWRARGREALLDDEAQSKAPLPGQEEDLGEASGDQENGTDGEEEEERHAREEGEGIVWNLRNVTHKQAKRRNLQVYLEETSVTQGETTPYVEKTIKKTFQVVSKATRSTRQSEAESDNDDHSDMGRKNSGRRRSRKGSRGDATSPQVKTPPTKKMHGQSPTSPQEAWAETHLAKGVTTETMTSLDATDARGDWEESCSRGYLESVHDPHTHSNARTHTHSLDFEGPVLATLATVDLEMDEDDDGGVVRKTETPESKRRSMKTSHSERVFAKKVLVNPDRELEEEEVERIGGKQSGRQVATVTSTKRAAVAAADSRGDEKALAIRTIINRIKLFEKQAGKPGSLPVPTHPRSADVSPSRSVADRIKMLDQNTGHMLLKRSSSAERADATRSSSAPPDRPKAQTVRERAKNFSRPALTEVFPEEAKPARNAQPAHRLVDSREAAKQPPWALKKAENSPEPAVTTTSAQRQHLIKGKSSAVSTVTRVQRAANPPSQPRPKPVEQEQTPVTQPARGNDLPDAAMPGDTPTQHSHTLAADAKDMPQARVSQADKKSRDALEDKTPSQSRGSLQTKHNALAEDNQSKMTPSGRSHNEDIPQTLDKDSQSKDTRKTKDTSDTKLILKATDSSHGGNRIKNKTAKETSQSSEQKIVSSETKRISAVKNVKSEDNAQVKDTKTTETIPSNNGSKAKDVVEAKDMTQRKDTITANSGLASEEVKCPETKPALKTNKLPEVLKSVENKDHSPKAKDDKMLTHDAKTVKDMQNNDSQQLTGDDTTAGKHSKAPGTEGSPTSRLTPKHCRLDEKTPQQKHVPQDKGPTEIKDTSNVELDRASAENSVNENKMNIQLSGATANKTSDDVGPQKDSIHHKTTEASADVNDQEAPQHQSSSSDSKQEITSPKQEVTADLSPSPANAPVVKRPPETMAGTADQSLTNENKTQSTDSTPVQPSEPVGQTVNSATGVEKAKLGQKYTEAKAQLAEAKQGIEKTMLGDQEHREAKTELAEAEKAIEKPKLADQEITEAKSQLAEAEKVIEKSMLGDEQPTEAKTQLAEAEKIIQKPKLVDQEDTEAKSQLAEAKKGIEKTKLGDGFPKKGTEKTMLGDQEHREAKTELAEAEKVIEKPKLVDQEDTEAKSQLAQAEKVIEKPKLGNGKHTEAMSQLTETEKVIQKPKLVDQEDTEAKSQLAEADKVIKKPKLVDQEDTEAKSQLAEVKKVIEKTTLGDEEHREAKSQPAEAKIVIAKTKLGDGQPTEAKTQLAEAEEVIEKTKLGNGQNTEAKSQLTETEKVIEKPKLGNGKHTEGMSQLAEAKKVTEKTTLGDQEHTEAMPKLTETEKVIEKPKLVDQEDTEAKSQLTGVDTLKVEVNGVSPPASNEQIVSLVEIKRVEEKSEERKSVPEQLTEAVTEATKDVLEKSTKAKSVETKVVPEQITKAPNKTEANIQPESPPALNSNSSPALEQGDQPAGIHISRSTYTPKKSKIEQVAKEVPDQIKVSSEHPSPVTSEQLSSIGTTDITKESLTNIVSETSDTIVPSQAIYMTPATPTTDIVTAGQETKFSSQSQDAESTTETLTDKSGEKDINLANMAVKNLTTAGVQSETQSNTLLEKSSKDLTPPGKASGTSTALSNLAKDKSSPTSLTNEEPSNLSGGNLGKATPDSSAVVDSTRKKNKFSLKGLDLRDFRPPSQDSPSSWLDLDVRPTGKPRQPLRSPKLSASVTNLDALGELDPQDFLERVKRLAIPFNVPPRSKINKLSRNLTPSFAMPAIHEASIEKTFDLDEFQFGLRKRREFSTELSLLREQKSEEREAAQERRRRHVERGSILNKSLLLRDTEAAKYKVEEEEGGKGEEKEGGKDGKGVVIKSRLEGSAILSSLRSTSRISRLGLLSSRGDPGSGPASPSETLSPNSPLARQPSPTEPSKSVLDQNHTGPFAAQLNQSLTLIQKDLLSQSSSAEVNKNPTEIQREPFLSNLSKDLVADKKDALVSNDLYSKDITQIAVDSYSSNQPKMPEVNNKLTQPVQSSLTSDQSASQTNQSDNQISQSELRSASSPNADIGFKFPSFDDIKFPGTGYLEKLLPQNNGRSDSLQKSDPETNKSDNQISQSELRSASSPNADIGLQFPSFDDIKFPGHLEKLLPLNHGRSDSLQKSDPEVTPTPAQPPEITPTRSPHDQTTILPVNGSHRRPGKMVLFERPQFEGQSYEIFRNVPDATALKFSAVVSAKVIRGCWILYEEPGFQGRSIPLVEGCVELANVWAGEGHVSSADMVIGSIRLAIRDYTAPRIDLFPEVEGHGFPSTYHSEAAQLTSYGLPQRTASIKVHSGAWLVYSEECFQGDMAVLTEGEYPAPQTWGSPTPAVGSLRPLVMGGLKVENPTVAKAVLYERPGLKGACLEISGDLPDVSEGQEATHTPLNPHIRTHTNKDRLNTVGSMKIVSGLWVGYEQVGFEGRQYILEEGEYLDAHDWNGTSEGLLSLRPVLVDFAAPHIRMYSGRDFSDVGVNIELVEGMANTQLTEYGLTTQSINVLSGVWVLFEGPDFCGQQYVVEKGQYTGPEDWGADNSTIASALPVFLADPSDSSKFKVELYSEPGLEGSVLVLDGSVNALPPDFTLQSCRVVSGSWLAYEREDYMGSVCVLEEGVYSDVRAMGFLKPSTAVRSLQITGFEFSIPSIVLYERGDLRGRRLVLTAGSVNLQLTGGCSRTQSVLVQGGMWVLYEGVNFRGAQVLLRPGTVPDWPKLSGWQRIGSLRPLLQKSVSFRLRNHETGLFLSISGALEDIKLMRIQATVETGGAEQVWAYQHGHLQCKLLEDCCMEPVGSMVRAGARLCVTKERGKPDQLWNITPDGLIRSYASPDLVIEVNGVQQYECQQVNLSPLSQSKLTQRWSVEFL